MSEKTVFAHLVDAITAVNKNYKATNPGETELDATKRMLIATSDIPEAVWAALPKHVQEWANTAAKQVNTMATPTPCPGFQTSIPEVVVPVVAAEASTVTATSETVVNASAIETAAAVKEPKAKKERKPKEPKAPKVEKPKLNLVFNVQTYCLQNPDQSVDQIMAGLSAKGVTPTRATVVIQSTAVKNVKKAAEAVGLELVPKKAVAA